MSKYKFSAKTNSFYPVEILECYEVAGTLPPDLLDVTDEAYATFIEQPPEGKVRGSKKGMPAWVNLSPPSEEQTKEYVGIKKQQLIDESDAIILRLERAVRLDMATDDEKSQLAAWERYSVLLSRVDVGMGADIEWPTPPV